MRELAKRSGLHAEDIKSLLDDGVPRLGLPGIQQYCVDRAKVELELAKQRERAKNAVEHKAVREAATERALTDAAAAQDLLSQAVTSGVIIGSYVETLAKQIASGETHLAIPEHVSPTILETLAKVADANSRTMERAIKMVRLTKGKPTEQIEHRIAMLLAACSVDELRQAAVGGGLPKRLVSRSSAEPLNDGAANVGINSREAVIDVDFVDGQEPGWLQEIAPAEGVSSEDDDGSAS